MSTAGRPWPRVLRRPPGGWSSLLALLGMLLIVGLSMGDRRGLALAGGSAADGLLLAVLLSGVVGFLLARGTVGPAAAHGIGAAVGAVVLLAIAGALAAPAGLGDSGPAPAMLLDRVRELAVSIEADLGRYLHEGGTAPASLGFLLLGGIGWATGQFSASAVYRYERAGPAIVATGVLLSLNLALPASGMATAGLPDLLMLAGYAALAMVLLVQLQVATQGRQWARRRIQDPGEARRLSLRAGMVFVGLVILTATTLTAVARAPAQDLGRPWAPIDSLGYEFSRWLSLFAVEVPATLDGRASDRLDVAETWRPGDGTAFVAEVVGGLRGNYWWLSAFDAFDGRTWTREDPSEVQVVAGEPIDIATDASGAGPEEIAVAVTPERSSLAAGTLLAPAEPLFVDRDVRVRSLGDDEGLAEIRFPVRVDPNEAYVVTSMVHDYRASSATLTASLLRSTGTDYPGWLGRYLRVDAGASGPRTLDLADRIATLASDAGASDPYSLAILLQDHLRTFEYRTSLAGLCRSGENVPECLLRTGAGFCQQYASTMVMVLRELGIPARFVTGYLPGERADDGSYVVPDQALHAWVEVYFPGIGWVRFDPTPGATLSRLQQQPTDFAEGDVIPSPIPGESPLPAEAVAPTSPAVEPSPSPGDEAAGSGAFESLGADPLTVLGLTVVIAALVLVALGLSLARLRRLPVADGSLAFGRIVGLATRLGHGPHPSQTEYEFASSLGEALPAVREDLHLVAGARVEARYGRRRAPSIGAPALRRAYGRVRLALVRWALRRDR